MGPYTMVVAIVAIAMIAGIFKHRLKLKEKQVEASKSTGGIDPKRVEELEKRVRTLEKIVTDKSNKLAEEIDKL